jgi:antitoxin (DNA-binding transcriptional repressor) of toxin-antitoxin stability system
MCHIMCHNACMTSVNIRQLRDTRKLKAWLRAGKTVALRERDRVIARIVPESLSKGSVKYPDFAARAKKVLGKRVLSGADLAIKERGRF